jgi:hypothetical protein
MAEMGGERTWVCPDLHIVNSLTTYCRTTATGRNQTDEDDLMPYSILNAIERHANFERKSPVEVFRRHENPTPGSCNNLKHTSKNSLNFGPANQWKRERFAPHFTWMNSMSIPVPGAGSQSYLQDLQKSLQQAGGDLIFSIIQPDNQLFLYLRL